MKVLLPWSVFAALVLVFTVSALELSDVARRVPVVVLVITGSFLVGTVVQLCAVWLGNRRNADRSSEATPVPGLLVDMGWFIAAPLALLLFGSVAGPALYAFAFVMLRAGLSLTRSLIYGLVVLAAVLLITQILTLTEPYPGLLIALLR